MKPFRLILNTEIIEKNWDVAVINPATDPAPNIYIYIYINRSYQQDIQLHIQIPVCMKYPEQRKILE